MSDESTMPLQVGSNGRTDHDCADNDECSQQCCSGSLLFWHENPPSSAIENGGDISRMNQDSRRQWQAGGPVRLNLPATTTKVSVLVSTDGLLGI